MKDNFNIFKNGRRPELFLNERRPHFFKNGRQPQSRNLFLDLLLICDEMTKHEFASSFLFPKPVYIRKSILINSKNFLLLITWPQKFGWPLNKGSFYALRQHGSNSANKCEKQFNQTVNMLQVLKDISAPRTWINLFVCCVESVLHSNFYSAQL